MTTKVINHDLRCVDGVTIYLPPCHDESKVNLGQPDVYAESEAPLYPIGTLAWFAGIGKKYRYSKAGEALWGTKFLAANGNHVPDGSGYENLNGFYDGGSVATCDVDATELTFTDTVDKAKDFYEGAFLLHFDAGRNTCYETSYIVSGPPTLISGATSLVCTVQLHKPKKYAKLSGDGIEIWCNPYSNILKGHSADGVYDSFETFMGVPEIPVQNGFYFWLQTAGPCFITPDGWGANCPGYTANSREAVSGLAFGNMNSALVLGAGYQRIGTVLSVTTSTDADALINLDLDLGR